MSTRRTTTIEISEETWKRLNLLKNVGESFDSVVSRLLNQFGEEI